MAMKWVMIIRALSVLFMGFGVFYRYCLNNLTDKVEDVKESEGVENSENTEENSKDKLDKNQV